MLSLSSRFDPKKPRKIVDVCQNIFSHQTLNAAFLSFLDSLKSNYSESVKSIDASLASIRDEIKKSQKGLEAFDAKLAELTPHHTRLDKLLGDIQIQLTYFETTKKETNMDALL